MKSVFLTLASISILMLSGCGDEGVISSSDVEQVQNEIVVENEVAVVESISYDPTETYNLPAVPAFPEK